MPSQHSRYSFPPKVFVYLFHGVKEAKSKTVALIYFLAATVISLATNLKPYTNSTYSRNAHDILTCRFSARTKFQMNVNLSFPQVGVRESCLHGRRQGSFCGMDVGAENYFIADLYQIR